MEYYGLVFLCFESSTPFLHVTWFASKQPRPNQTLLRLSSISTVVIFFCVRIVFGTYEFLQVQLLLSDFEVDIQPFTRYFFIVALTLLTGLNYFWFYKMLQKFLSSIAPKERSKVH